MSTVFHKNYTGDKRYELSNHLGNVLQVITDRKLPVEGVEVVNQVLDIWSAIITISVNDINPKAKTNGLLMTKTSINVNAGVTSTINQ